MLDIAGIEKADTVPLAASRTSSDHTSACPEITSHATTAWVPADSRYDVCITADLERRSATTPPRSRNATIGTVRAARASPESVTARTAKASAIGAIVDPAVEITRDA